VTFHAAFACDQKWSLRDVTVCGDSKPVRSVLFANGAFCWRRRRWRWRIHREHSSTVTAFRLSGILGSHVQASNRGGDVGSVGLSRQSRLYGLVLDANESTQPKRGSGTQ